MNKKELIDDFLKDFKPKQDQSWKSCYFFTHYLKKNHKIKAELLEGMSRINKIENYLSAIFIAKYPKLSKALINHAKTYNECLNFIQNPPSDCEIVQICPPNRLEVKRDTIDHDLLKEGYQIGINSAVSFMDNNSNLFASK